jgi:signal peptidase I
MSNVTEVKSFLKTIAVFVILAIVLRASVVEAFKIPSGSMIPTLLIGDHILVTKFNYGLRLPFMKLTAWQWRTPKHGDIVVFTRPDDPATLDKDESDINIIKRVGALPGDTLEVRDRTVLINNKPVHEPYEVRWEEGGQNWFKPYTVPQGCVVVLGDNRDKSNDSRFWPTGPCLETSRIKGKAPTVVRQQDFNIGAIASNVIARNLELVERRRSNPLPIMKELAE